MKNNKESSEEPWGTPEFIEEKRELCPFIPTNCFLSVKKERKHFKPVHIIPYFRPRAEKKIYNGGDIKKNSYVSKQMRYAESPSNVSVVFVGNGCIFALLWMPVDLHRIILRISHLRHLKIQKFWVSRFFIIFVTII